MALDVNDRYASATEMLRDMEEFRKNPEIRFNYHSVLDDATRPLRGMENLLPRNTAQRVAKAGGGSTSVSRETGKTGSARTGQNTGTARSSDAIRRAQQRRREEERREAERSRVAAIAVVACSVVAVVSIVVFLVTIFNGTLLRQEQDLVDVPYLEGWPYSEELADRYPDFTLRLQPQQYSDKYAKGQIMHQEPVGGSRVSKGTEIFLTVSMGVEPEVKVMENLIDVTEEEARAFLSGQGFNPLCRYKNSSVYAEGRVICTDPEYGTELKSGQTINLWISTGPKTVFAKMPGVVGMMKQEALDLLESKGFANVVSIDVESDEPKGKVVSQSAEKNTELDVNTEIRLEISEGPEPTEESTTETTQAPTAPPETQTTPTEPSPVHVTFSLPVREEAYYLSILQNGTEIVSNVEIAPGSNGYVLALTGSGVQTYDLYINGQFYQTQRVEFS